LAETISKLFGLLLKRQSALLGWVGKKHNNAYNLRLKFVKVVKSSIFKTHLIQRKNSRSKTRRKSYAKQLPLMPKKPKSE